MDYKIDDRELNALLYNGSNSHPQFPHSLSACLIADIKAFLSDLPSNHCCAGIAIKSQPDETNFSIIEFNSSIISSNHAYSF